MIQFGLRKIYTELASKYGIDEREVEKIISSEFKLVADMMKKGEGADPITYENIMLHHFGTFHILEKRVEKKYKKDGEHSK